MRVLIVDDEPLACERLRTLLSGERDVTIVAECHDGRAAVAAIRDLPTWSFSTCRCLKWTDSRCWKLYASRRW